MKRMISAAVFTGLVCLPALSGASAGKPEPPLGVTVDSSLHKSGLMVKLTITNNSDTYQIFQSISCSWQEFWQTDSKDALLMGQSACAKNSLYTVILAPGEKHVEKPSILLFRGKPGKRMIRFGYSRHVSDFSYAELKQIYNSPEKNTYFSRISIASRFKPGKETFWSAPITVKVSKQSILH